MSDVLLMGAGSTAAAAAPPPASAVWDPAKKASNINLSTVTVTNDTATGDNTNHGTVLSLTGYTYPAPGTVRFLINDVDGSVGLATAGQNLGPGGTGYLGNGDRTGVQLGPTGVIFWNNAGSAPGTGPTFSSGDVIEQVHDSLTARVTWNNITTGSGALPVGGFDISTIQPSFNSTFYAGFTPANDGGTTITASDF